MTTTHACGSELHGQVDALRDRREALAAELKAAWRPAQSGFRDPKAGEKVRISTARERLETTDEELRKARRALEDHHSSLKCAGPGTTRSSTAEADQFLASLNTLGAKGTTAAGTKGADHRWSSRAFEQMGGRSGFEAPSKSLAAPGAVLVPTAFDGVPVREGERPDSIRRLIPTTTLTGTDRFGYLRQATRVNNAAPVARGRLKPTSSYTLERVEDRARVIAHLSEPIAKSDLDDSADLAAFLDSELRYGVLWATEDQIVNGDGTGEEITGILATEGITAQAWAGDLFTTTRRALTIQQQLANTPTAWAINPGDWERFELAREDSPTTGGFVLATGPVDRAAQRLWGLPVVAADVVPTGTAILGDFAGSARIYQREETAVLWSDAMYYPAGDGDPASSAFARNQLHVRAEERVGLAITRPSAFTEVELSAGA